MDSETRRQIGELEELHSAHRGRLQVLEIQAARQGHSAPPEVLTEIADIKTKLVPIDAALFKLTYVGTVRADVPGNDRDGQAAISRAVERTIERERRAIVAAQRDADMLNEVRIAAAIAAMRHALMVVGALALFALITTIALTAYLAAKGGL